MQDSKIVDAPLRKSVCQWPLNLITTGQIKMSGSMNTCIATLVERHSRLVMLVKVDGKDTKT
ncbi:MAG: hypothetical protein V3U76_05860 [Granulosicoccus sp.]